jgi:hypothetical protein
MAKARRLFIIGAAVLLVLVTARGVPPVSPEAAQAQAVPQAFAEPSPAKLYAGDFSHPGLANATPAPARNGYCITVNAAGITSVGGDRGFTIVNGTILSTDFFHPATATSSVGDVYCAVVRATTTANVPLVLSWQHTDGATTTVANLAVPVIGVSLQAFGQAFVGGSAQVCTLGWARDNVAPPAGLTTDNTVGLDNFGTPNNFLTGFDSNDSNDPNVPPNPINVVALDDWNPTAVTRFQNSDVEQCANIPGVAPGTVAVTFDFWAVYNRQITTDDQSHTAGPVDVTFIQAFVLHHIGAAGQEISEQDFVENVIGSRHRACIIGSGPGDTLNPRDINFVNISPPPGANAVGIQIFSSNQNTPPDANTIPAVAAGTLCFGWTSTQPGEQLINLTFTRAGGERIFVNWAPPDSVAGSGALLKQWNIIDRTEITAGEDPREAGTVLLTNGTVTQRVVLNVAGGTFLFEGGDLSFTEWVFGSHVGPSGPLTDVPLEGVVIEATITTPCGTFVRPNPPPDTIRVKSFTDVTVGGVVPFTVSIANDAGCGASSVIHIELDAFTPGNPNVFFATETLDIQLDFTTASKTPEVAWAGQIIEIVYSFAGNCPGAVARFVRSSTSPGGFIADPGVNLIGPDSAAITIPEDGGACTATVRYESEDQGQVDIEAFLESDEFDATAFSKQAFVFFYMQIEDVTASATASANVSAVGSVSATATGWFKNANPSGRPAETKADGRVVPADRWILPADWPTLRGLAEFRPTWPGSPAMPPVLITFLMQNESIVNSFPAGIRNGASGFFLLSPDILFPNVNPRTGVPSVLGSPQRPRIVTIEGAGATGSVSTFGDFNLSFEECAVNPPTGSPHCDVGDIVGRTQFVAVVDYPGLVGKFPAVASPVVTTTWTWGGYKQVTIQDTDSPAVKFVVAHLKDRDGFCDAIGFNNVLGIPVTFKFDAGEGRILEAQAPPVTIDRELRSATATTFDTVDPNGTPIHQDIAKTVISADECQAWVKVANTLLTPATMVVTFPGMPAPVPGDVRITGLVCADPSTVTVTNQGTNPVSLAGFTLRAPAGTETAGEPYLELDGVLQPGESAVFPGPGGPGWVGATSLTPGSPDSFVRLVWNEFEVSRILCNGSVSNPPIPASLPADGEGPIIVSVTIPFGAAASQPLVAGWNLVTAAGSVGIVEAMGSNAANVESVYSWDEAAGTWLRWASGAPAYLATIDQFEANRVYWVQVKRPFTLNFE